MFHLYFGAFDIVLYLGSTYFAIAFANALCKSLDQAGATQTVTPATPATVAPNQTVAPKLPVPVVKPQEISVRVPVNS